MIRFLAPSLSILPLAAGLQVPAQDVGAAREKHVQRVLSVRFSPDGRLIAGAVCGKERVRGWYVESGRVQVWDAATGNPVRALARPAAETLSGTGNWTRAIAVAPGGKAVAIGRDDRTVQLRDRETDAELAAWQGPAEVDVLAFSPDGKALACAYRGNSERGAELSFLDLATRKPRWRETIPRSSITAIAFSPDGARVAVASLEHTHARGGPSPVAILDAKTGREERTVRGGPEGARALAFSPDATTLAAAYAVGPVLSWDARTGVQTRALPVRSPGRVAAVAFSPDGATLATASLRDRIQVERPGNLRLWDAHTGELRRELTTDADPASSAAFSPDATSLAIGRDDGTVTRIRLADEQGR
ncbi:translocation protein TolB [Aquisphaera giovannonii]|uniref:Translocation protein TolB n=1 Tax=Aquisphaera giovannonii TaxID=406548 RepID=A0A5B9W2Z4_9BACT|nr:hypothetical protein [Aquisphaera giovannonii]QEH34986.1 translocation protein TolB [Aquisphaera giovannonii]